MSVRYGCTAAYPVQVHWHAGRFKSELATSLGVGL